MGMAMEVRIITIEITMIISIKVKPPFEAMRLAAGRRCFHPTARKIKTARVGDPG
jgi:hypothetical protein